MCAQWALCSRCFTRCQTIFVSLYFFSNAASFFFLSLLVPLVPFWYIIWLAARLFPSSRYAKVNRKLGLSHAAFYSSSSTSSSSSSSCLFPQLQLFLFLCCAILPLLMAMLVLLYSVSSCCCCCCCRVATFSSQIYLTLFMRWLCKRVSVWVCWCLCKCGKLYTIIKYNIGRQHSRGKIMRTSFR